MFLQATFATALLAAIPYVFNLPNLALVRPLPTWVWFFPPAWFLGLYETLLGVREKYLLDLSALSGKALGVAAFVGLLTYLVSYHRHASRVLDEGRKISRDSMVTRISRKCISRLVPNPYEQAALAFAIKTLARSRHHKLILVFRIGVAFILVLNSAGPVLLDHFALAVSWEVWQLQAVIAAPLILSTTLIFALCYVFQLPTEWKANWIFRMAEGSHRRQLLNSVPDVLIICGLVPPLVIALPAQAFALGWSRAFENTLLLTVVILLLIELRLSGWNKIPFTCYHLSGQKNIWALVAKYLALFGIAIPLVTLIDVHMLQGVLLLVGTTAFAASYWRLRTVRQRRWEVDPLLFEETEDGEVGTMQLG